MRSSINDGSDLQSLADVDLKKLLYLQQILSRYSNVFTHGSYLLEKSFQFFLNVTLGFDRVWQDMYLNHFRVGYPDYQIPGIISSDRMIRRAKRQLRENGVIFYDYDPSKSASQVRYIVNVTGMLKVLKPVLVFRDDEKGRKWKAGLNRLIKRADREMREYGSDLDLSVPVFYHEEVLMKIKEAVEKGKKKSKVAMNKKRQKLRLKENPTAGDVINMMREFGEKYDMKATGTSTVKSRNKMKLWARNYSANAGVADTWWEHLELIMKHWSRYRGVLIDPDGARSILLPKAFAWDFYFMRPKYATLIDSWIMTYDETEDPVASILENVVDITDYSKLSKKEG